MKYSILERVILDKMREEKLKGQEPNLLLIPLKDLHTLKAEPNCIDISRYPLMYCFGLLVIPSDFFGVGTVSTFISEG